MRREPDAGGVETAGEGAAAEVGTEFRSVGRVRLVDAENGSGPAAGVSPEATGTLRIRAG